MNIRSASVFNLKNCPKLTYVKITTKRNLELSIKTCPQLTDVIIVAQAPQMIVLRETRALKSLVLDFGTNCGLTHLDTHTAPIFVFDSILESIEQFYIRSGSGYGR